MPAAAEPVEEEIPGFFEEYKKTIIFGGSALLLAIVGYGSWQVVTQNAIDSATASYAAAVSEEQLQAVVAEHGNQQVAANALLELAEMARNDGRIDEAEQYLQQFMDNYPNHPLTGTAMLSQAANREANGEIDGAIEVYRQIPAKYSGSYAAPLARLFEAELLALQEQSQQAVVVLEDIVANYQNTPAAMVARNRLMLMDLPEPEVSPEDPAELDPEPAVQE